MTSDFVNLDAIGLGRGRLNNEALWKNYIRPL